jgi:hypothetical protein
VHRRGQSGVNSTAPADLAPSQRRLQRPPDFTGAPLRSFRAVFLRHGLPGLLLGALCLAHPDLRALLPDALAGFSAAPLRYLTVGLGILAALVAYGAFIDRRLDARQVGWIFYLLLLSVWEEWLFRLAIPWLNAAQGLDARTAAIVSNALFGFLHYFTLRWKWYWCVAAFLGGMALSRHMGQHHDLAMVIAFHWIATFLNTPRLPGRAGRGG